MKCLLFLGILLVSVLAFGQIKSPLDLIVAPSTILNSPVNLTAEQVDEDTALLIQVLQKGFSGRFYFSLKQLNKFTADIGAIKGAMSTTDFWTKLDDVLLTIPDNHTAATMYLNGYDKMSAHRLAQSRQPQVGKNKISDSSKVWEVSRVGKNHDISLIAITSFPPSGDKIWKTFLSSVTESLAGSQAAIIDLRNNRGGDDSFGMELAKIFWGGPFHHVVEKQYNLTSPEAVALFANRYRLNSIEMAQALNPNSATEQTANLYSEEVKKALAGKFPEVQIRAKGGSDPSAIVTATGYKKPIYVLIDSMTASSGEFTSLAFARHPFAKIIGENSAGYVHFGNAGKLLLPNSKVQVLISTQFSQLENDLFIEKVGITPNEITTGRNAFDTAISEIEKP